MAVDSLRETRHINRISPKDHSTLWTAQSYRPDITSALSAVRRMPRWFPLGEMCLDPIAQGRTPEYATNDSGYPCLKTKHINGLIVDDSSPDWVTLECATSLARFKVQQSTPS
jgi:type I restriction enzyme S subunit